MSQSKCGKTTFSAMFWNVEHFGRDPRGPLTPEDCVRLAAEHITCLNPDLFCLCEIYDKAAFRGLLMNEFSDYDFAVTDDQANMNLVVGWRRGKFEQVVFTQRGELQAGRERLRPGALTSVKFGGEWFNFLFLHLKSGSLCSAYKLRKDMFKKIWALKGRLDCIHTNEFRDGASDSSASSNSGVSADDVSDNGASDNSASSNGAKFVVMGDLNTMGRSDCARSDDISAAEELKKLEKAAAAGKRRMRLLSKTSDKTWSNDTSSETSDLDHVLATKDNVRFNKPQADVEVRVSGWNQLKGDERETFIKNISDHSSLFCEIVVGERASESTSDDAESS